MIVHGPWSGWPKRCFDCVAAAVGLILLAPVLALIAATIRLAMGPPVVFRQQRPGLHGRPFTLYKFRTMTDTSDVDGRLLPERERVTQLGRILRRTSVDELPELFNVIKGDMSLVGPRPLLMRYLERYTREQFRRHEARPGITGRGAQEHPRPVQALMPAPTLLRSFPPRGRSAALGRPGAG